MSSCKLCKRAPCICDTAKVGICNMCEREVYFFPHDKEYETMPKRSLITCYVCVEKGTHRCKNCNQRFEGYELIICDGCGTDGQSCFTCAGVKSLPEGYWCCDKECYDKYETFMNQQQQQATKKPKTSFSVEEKARLFDENARMHEEIVQTQHLVSLYRKYDYLKPALEQYDEVLKRINALRGNPEIFTIEEAEQMLSFVKYYHELKPVLDELTQLQKTLVFPQPDLNAKLKDLMTRIVENYSASIN